MDPKLALFVAATLLVATGCPSADPEGKYDEFLDNTEEEREEAQNMPDFGGALVDVSGTGLMALSPIIAPDLPLQFIATAEMEIAPDQSGATLDLTLQPLSLNPGSRTEPREPIGDPISLPGIEVMADGSYVADIGEVMVTGLANPITGGDIVAQLIVMGNIQNVDLTCGSVEGAVTAPISADLAGSTFATQRVDDTSPAALPVDFLTGCPEGGAEEGGAEDGGGSTGEEG